MATIDSLNNLIASTVSNGNWPVHWSCLPGATTTAATATCGYVSGQRFAQTIAMPTMTAPVIGANLTAARVLSVATDVVTIIGIEYLLGTLTVSGNSYADGVAMPSKTVFGSSVQTAASLIYAVVTTTLTATTPVLTFNYTNQSGTTGRSSTVTLPTNSVAGSAFGLAPHLQSGDTAVRDLSASGPNGLSISTGSAGVIKVYGLLPLLQAPTSGSYSVYNSDPLSVSNLPYLIESTDVLAVYRLGGTANNLVMADLNFVPAV